MKAKWRPSEEIEELEGLRQWKRGGGGGGGGGINWVRKVNLLYHRKTI